MSHLPGIRREFQAISERARLVAGLIGSERLATRPRPQAWSVAACLAHLTLTASAYLPIWHEAMRRARTAGRVGHEPFTLDWVGRSLCWFLEPPPKLRFWAPRAFIPSESLVNGQALQAFLDSQAKVLEALTAAEGLPLDRIRIRSAFAPWFRYSLWASFCANASHHRRHVWQAEQVAAALLRQTLLSTERHG